MADTGEDREIKQRVNAHQKEVVREMKALAQTANVRSAKNKVESRSTSRPKTKLRISAPGLPVDGPPEAEISRNQTVERGTSGSQKRLRRRP
jgi:hypothetical protein